MHGMAKTAGVGAIVMTLAGRPGCCDLMTDLNGYEQPLVSVLAHPAPVFTQAQIGAIAVAGLQSLLLD